MEKSLLIAGFGGQGVMLIGKILGYAAVDMGLYATYFPAYGAEQRGGTANCTLITGEEPIECPLRGRYDCLIIMNELSFERFAASLRPGGLMIINSSLVTSRPASDIDCVEIDTGAVANEVGNPKVSNMVMLGAYIALSGKLDVEKIKSIVRHSLANKPQLLELNLKAIDAGGDSVRRQRSHS